MLAFALLSAKLLFDLTCNGVQTTKPLPRLPGETKPFTENFRIDLATMRWCEGQCAKSYPVARVSAVEIVLVDANDGAPLPMHSRLAVLNRETGELTDRYQLLGIDMTRVGSCTVSEFSGLPEPKF